MIAANLARHDGHTRADLERTGLVRLPGVVPPEWLAAARADVDGFLSRHGSGEHSLVDADRWDCPTIAELAVDERVESFLHSLTPPSVSAAAGFAGYRQRVLRILDGSAVDSPPFDWHYDANAVTMLVPVVVPDGTGDLALFPDHRPHRRSATVDAASACWCTTASTAAGCDDASTPTRRRSPFTSLPVTSTSSGATARCTPRCPGPRTR